VQATRLATSFEILTGSVALTGLEKFSCKATCVLVFFLRKSPRAPGRLSVQKQKLFSYNFSCLLCLLTATVIVALLVKSFLCVQMFVTKLCIYMQSYFFSFSWLLSIAQTKIDLVLVFLSEIILDYTSKIPNFKF